MFFLFYCVMFNVNYNNAGGYIYHNPYVDSLKKNHGTILSYSETEWKFMSHKMK